MTKSMNTKNIGKAAVAVFFLMLFSAFVWAIIERTESKPSAVIKKYWKLCLSQKFDEANMLKSKSSVQTSVSKDGASIGFNIQNTDGSIEDCCYSREIAQKKLKIVKIVEEKINGLNARVKVKTENTDKNSEVYTGCLIQEQSRWIIVKVFLSEEDKDKLCFSGDTGITNFDK